MILTDEPGRVRAILRRQLWWLCALVALSTSGGCARLSLRDRDQELLSRFGLNAPASHDSSMVVLRAELLRHVPLGSTARSVETYLDSLGFVEAPNGLRRRRTMVDGGAVIIEARLEHHSHHWYDVGPCNYTHEIRFALDAASHVQSLGIDESGSCV